MGYLDAKMPPLMVQIKGRLEYILHLRAKDKNEISELKF